MGSPRPWHGTFTATIVAVGHDEVILKAEREYIPTLKSYVGMKGDFGVTIPAIGSDSDASVGDAPKPSEGQA